MKPVTIPLKDRTEFKYRLLMSLGKGRDRALTGRILASRCNYDSNGSDRMTRKMIAQLIEEGYPIASTTGQPPGFFIAETKEEVNKYAKGLKGRLIEDAIRRRNFLRASRKILQPEQLKMEEGIDLKGTKLMCPIHHIPLNKSKDWKPHDGLDPKMIRAACNDCNDYWYKAPKRCLMRKEEVQAAFGIDLI